MGFEDRDWNRSEPSGPGRVLARVFENVDNPLGWSIKLFSLRGIVVRAHVILILWLVLQPLFSINQGAVGFAWMAIGMGALFLIVTIHEFGHCFACRYVGGIADRIVLLPWGGLALCMPPHAWKPAFITTVGGPAVHVVLAPIFAGLVLAAGVSPDVLLFNPINPFAEFSHPSFGGSLIWLQVAAFWLYAMNLFLFAFNVFLPFFPLDGGRMVQELLWAKYGYRKSMEMATGIGLFGALFLGVVGLAMGNVFLVIIGVFGGLTCWGERQRLRADVDLAHSGMAGMGAMPTTHNAPRGPSKREVKRREKAQRDEQTLDELLEKIAREGMNSLSRSERRTLDRLSKARREGSLG